MWNLFKRKSAAAEPGGAWDFVMALMTDPGCQRTVNQDRGRLTKKTGSSAESERALLAVVADGMGGHQGGEVASELALDVICREFQTDNGNPGAALAWSVEQANRAIYSLARQRPDLQGMGTTCTALTLLGDFAWVAHVGDSRLYLIRNGAIYQMTEDHSLVMEMVRKGTLSLEDARLHPERNVLSRALGTQQEVEVTGWEKPIPIQSGDHFLLCTDGLPTLLTDESIRDVVLSNEPAEACSRLIEMARHENAPDNVTVGIIRVDAARTGLPVVRETRTVEMMPGAANGQPE